MAHLGRLMTIYGHENEANIGGDGGGGWIGLVFSGLKGCGSGRSGKTKRAKT